MAVKTLQTVENALAVLEVVAELQQAVDGGNGPRIGGGMDGNLTVASAKAGGRIRNALASAPDSARGCRSRG